VRYSPLSSAQVYSASPTPSPDLSTCPATALSYSPQVVSARDALALLCLLGWALPPTERQSALLPTRACAHMQRRDSMRLHRLSPYAPGATCERAVRSFLRCRNSEGLRSVFLVLAFTSKIGLARLHDSRG